MTETYEGFLAKYKGIVEKLQAKNISVYDVIADSPFKLVSIDATGYAYPHNFEKHALLWPGRDSVKVNTAQEAFQYAVVVASVLEYLASCEEDEAGHPPAEDISESSLDRERRVASGLHTFLNALNDMGDDQPGIAFFHYIHDKSIFHSDGTISFGDYVAKGKVDDLYRGLLIYGEDDAMQAAHGFLTIAASLSKQNTLFPLAACRT